MILISAINFLGDQIEVVFSMGITEYENDLFSIQRTPIIGNQVNINDNQLLNLYKLAIADFESQLLILNTNPANN